MKVVPAALWACALMGQTPPAPRTTQPQTGPATRPSQPPAPERPAPVTPAKPAATPPMSMINFDVRNLDRSVSPCTDFYQFACGGWIKSNPIPADQSRWGRFNALAERNREVLKQILEDSARAAAGRDAITQKIGDYYSACMDEKAVEAKGLAPIEPELQRIRDLKDKSELAAQIVRMHRNGVAALFEFSSGQDFKNSSEVIAQADQGGLGLPDRDYYLKDDPKSVELRQRYQEHVQRMFELAGEKPDQAKADAAVVMRIETGLAKGSLDRVRRVAGLLQGRER